MDEANNMSEMARLASQHGQLILEATGGMEPKDRANALRGAVYSWKNLGDQPHWWPALPWPKAWKAGGAQPETYAGLTFALAIAQQKCEIPF